MPKNKINGKSTTRKPLRDVSNGNIRSSKPANKKAPHITNDDDQVFQEDDVALDRLLLAHSHLSSLMHQIDELVVQALEVKSNKGREEVQSFAQVLTEIQSSLKPWAPRFQKALSSDSIGSENKAGLSLVNGTVSITKEDTNVEVQSPEHTEYDARISPSPLVSWRADCTVEGGRQLFLLTPLPRPKAFSSKLQCPSAIEKIISNPTFNVPSCISICGHANDDLPAGVSIKPTPSIVSDPIPMQIEPGSISPQNFSKKGCSLLVMTPCLKMSPPKSCVLLEPISELSRKNNHGFRKSTPYPVGIQDSSCSETSESSSSEASVNLALKYPELFGIQKPQNLGNGRKAVKASPDWLMSPPKTCVLMEPPDEKSLANSTSKYQFPKTSYVQNQQMCFSIMKGSDFQRNHDLTRKFCSQEHGATSALIESTPVLKEPESTFQTGKRAGENTLKKELWTRFEAASVRGVVSNISVLQETAKKGFLDRLEEVSFDEDKSGA